MAQIVEMDCWHSRLLQRGQPDAPPEVPAPQQRARGTGEHDTVIAWLSEARQMPAENWRDFRQPTDIPYIEQARNWFTAMWDTISYEYPA